MMNGFGCYLKYLGIKSHFENETYDYFKYKGKVRAGVASYNKRKDKYYFEKLSKLLKKEELIEQFFLSNFVCNKRLWIGEAFGDSAKDNYDKWKNKIERISYIYLQDLRKIKDTKQTLKESFQCINGQHPIVLKMILKNELALESIIILDSLIPFLNEWNEQISESIVWPELYKRAMKYKPFLESLLNKTQQRRFKITTKQILID